MLGRGTATAKRPVSPALNELDKSAANGPTYAPLESNAPGEVGGIVPIADPASTASPTATTAGSNWDRPPSGHRQYGETPAPSRNLAAVRSEAQPSTGNGPSARCDWCLNRAEGCAFCRPNKSSELGPIAWDPGRTSRKQEANPRTAPPTTGILHGEGTSPPCKTQ